MNADIWPNISTSSSKGYWQYINIYHSTPHFFSSHDNNEQGHPAIIVVKKYQLILIQMALKLNSKLIGFDHIWLCVFKYQMNCL